MKTLIFAYSRRRGYEVAEEAGLTRSEVEYIGSGHALRGRCTGGQPRIRDWTFTDHRAFKDIMENLCIADMRPVRTKEG